MQSTHRVKDSAVTLPKCVVHGLVFAVFKVLKSKPTVSFLLAKMSSENADPAEESLCAQCCEQGYS